MTSIRFTVLFLVCYLCCLVLGSPAPLKDENVAVGAAQVSPKDDLDAAGFGWGWGGLWGRGWGGWGGYPYRGYYGGYYPYWY